MLRKISAAEPVFTVIATVCIEAPDIAPDASGDPPPEFNLLPQPPGVPVPPIIINPDNGGPIFGAVDPAPVCPIPKRADIIDPLTGQLRYYYYYDDKDLPLPPGCGIGAFSLF